MLGAKGASESFKGLSKLDDLNAGKSVSKLTEEAEDELGSINKGLKADEVKGKGYKSASDYLDQAKARLAESKSKYGSGNYGGDGYGKYQGNLMQSEKSAKMLL